MNFLETVGLWFLLITGALTLLYLYKTLKERRYEKATLLMEAHPEIKEIFNFYEKKYGSFIKPPTKIFGRNYRLNYDKNKIEEAVNKKIKELEKVPEQKLIIDQTIAQQAKKYKEIETELYFKINELELLYDKYNDFLLKIQVIKNLIFSKMKY